MAINVLNLLFGPSMPPEMEVIGLSFIAAPVLQPDSSIASLSSERYVRENYSHLNQFTVFDSSSVGDYIGVSFIYPGTTFGGVYANMGGNSGGGRIDLQEQGWALESLHSPIRVKGMSITRDGSWFPLIESGVVWRQHTIHTNESASSWLIRSGLEVGDEVYLIYTVPESRYGTKSTNSSNTFPGSGSQLKTVVEIASVVTPSQLSYEGNIKVLQGITVNGSSKFSGSYDGATEDTYIRRMDPLLKIIDLKDSLLPDDHVRLEYLTYMDSYTYSGYKDYTGRWYSFDGNPEYGHFINDPDDYILKASSACLLRQATIYLIPTAYVRATTTSGTGTYLGDVDFVFTSAFDYGETHFVRHIIGQPDEEITADQDAGPINTWGHAVFGKNTYDQGVYSSNDIFSTVVPSMMPLGRLVLAAPASVNSIAHADIRLRGGGVPLDFPMTAVNTEAEGLDKLRGFWDLGIVDGKAIKEGGVIVVEVDSSLLDTYTADEIYTTVKDQVPLGVDVEIKYVNF